MKAIKRDKYKKLRWICDGCQQENYSTSNICKFEVCRWIVPAPCDRCMDAVGRGEKKLEDAYTGQLLQRLSEKHLDTKTYLEFQNYPKLGAHLEELRPYVGKYLCVGCMPGRGMLRYGPGESRPQAGCGFVDQFIDREVDDVTRERLRWIQRQVKTYADRLSADGETDEAAWNESARILHRIASGRPIYSCKDHAEVIQMKPGVCPVGGCTKNLFEQDPEPLRYESLVERVIRVTQGANPSGLILKRNQNSEGMAEIAEDIRAAIRVWEVYYYAAKNRVANWKADMARLDSEFARRIALIKHEANGVIERKKALGQEIEGAEAFWSKKLADAQEEHRLARANADAEVGVAEMKVTKGEMMLKKYGHPRLFPKEGLLYALLRKIEWNILDDLHRRDKTVYKCTDHESVIEMSAGNCPIKGCEKALIPIDPEPLGNGGLAPEYFADTSAVQKELDDNGPPQLRKEAPGGITDWIIEKDPKTGRDIRFWNKPKFKDTTTFFREHDMPEDPVERKKYERFHRRMYTDPKTGKAVEKYYEPFEVPTINFGRAPINEAKPITCDRCKRLVPKVWTEVVGPNTQFVCETCRKDEGFASKYKAAQMEKAARRGIRRADRILASGDCAKALREYQSLEHLYLDAPFFKANEERIKATIVELKGEDEAAIRNRLQQAKEEAISILKEGGKFDLIEPVIYLDKETLDHEISILVVSSEAHKAPETLNCARTAVRVIQTEWKSVRASFFWAYLGGKRREEWIAAAKSFNRIFDHLGVSPRKYTPSGKWITNPVAVAIELGQPAEIDVKEEHGAWIKKRTGLVFEETRKGYFTIDLDKVSFDVFWALADSTVREAWTKAAKKMKAVVCAKGLMKPIVDKTFQAFRCVEPEKIAEALFLKIPRLPTEYYQLAARLRGYEEGAMPENEEENVLATLQPHQWGHSDLSERCELRKKGLLPKPAPKPKPEPEEIVLNTKGYGPFVNPMPRTEHHATKIRDNWKEVLERDERWKEALGARTSLDSHIAKCRKIVEDPRSGESEKESARGFLSMYAEMGHEKLLAIWPLYMARRDSLDAYIAKCKRTYDDKNEDSDRRNHAKQFLDLVEAQGYEALLEIWGDLMEKYSL